MFIVRDQFRNSSCNAAEDNSSTTADIERSKTAVPVAWEKPVHSWRGVVFLFYRSGDLAEGAWRHKQNRILILRHLPRETVAFFLLEKRAAMNAMRITLPENATDAALLRCLYDIAATGRNFLALAHIAPVSPLPAQFREVWQSVQTGISIARERGFDAQHHEVFERLELLSTELRERF
jgi:hypothetical protein